MKAMILAAGRGSRMRPLTDTIPKPLLRINDHSIIEHLIFGLRDQGFNELVINLAHLGEQIKSLLQGGEKYGVSIIYSEEDPKGALETGGGILKALPLLGHEPFLVVSGDIWTNYPFGHLKEKPLSGLAHLVLVDNPLHHVKGDFHLENGKLHVANGQRLTFGNIGVYHPHLFEGQKSGVFPLGPLLHEAVSKGLVTGEYFQGKWENIGTLESLRKVALMTIKETQTKP